MSVLTTESDLAITSEDDVSLQLEGDVVPATTTASGFPAAVFESESIF